MKSLADLQNAFKGPDREAGNLPNNYYPFWNMKEGEQAIVRFVPDANTNNPFDFLVEKVTHSLLINGEKKSVPCLSMYGEDCPICAVSQAYYKAEDKDNGKKYWKKKQYITQAIVIEDPLEPDKETKETHEGKLRYIALGYQLFNIIKESFGSGELDTVPYAYEGGTNFIIKKSKQGDYATYTIGSKFARKSSDLDEDVVANLQLADLSTLLPKHPGREKVEAMLEAALTGANYNDGKDSAKSTPAPAKPGANKPKASALPTADDNGPVSTPEGLEDEADDILAQIRNRKKAKAE